MQVFQFGECLCFPLEALHESGIACKQLRQYLDRDVTVSGGFVGFVDGCHATLADFLDDLVAAKLLSNQVCHLYMSLPLTLLYLRGF